MRVRLWHIAVFLIALGGFAILRAPAWLTPERAGVFTYEQARGTIWTARYDDVHIGPYSVAEVAVRPSASHQMLGALATFRGGDIEGEALFQRGLGGDRSIAASTLSFDGVPLTPALAVRGETIVRNLDIAFEHGACVRAAGDVSSETLQNAAALLGAAGPALTGSARCEGEAALIALSGASAYGETADVRVRLLADGSGEWRVGWKSANASAIRALGAAGFTTDGAEEASLSGRMTWALF